MNWKRNLVITAGLLMVMAGCKEKSPVASETAAPAESRTPLMPAAAASPEASGFLGSVVETMNAGSYTYIQVDTGSRKVWAATPRFAVKVGEAVMVPPGMAMTNYHSATLNRDFDVVYFVDTVRIGTNHPPAVGNKLELPKGHPPLTGQAAQTQVDVSGIKKVEGGQTIEEIFAGRTGFQGKEVELRGKVVKFTPQIMGENWLHLQDGTGATGSNDLTVTTSGMAKVGDTVLATGTLALNKDLGHGYKYEVILENAKIVVE